MKYIYSIWFKIALVLLIIIVVCAIGCKKFDLVRIAMIETEQVANVTTNSVEAKGSVIDLGESNTGHGFYYKKSSDPAGTSTKVSDGKATSTGDFTINITGLSNNTNYEIWTYIEDGDEVYYGNTEYFKTLAAITSEWLHYDDGVNFNSIGFTGGGDFDVAIRFPAADIQQYAGASITKIKFFPAEGTETEYYVTIWEGGNPPVLMYYEYVPSPNIDNWTTYTLPTPYLLDVSVDLWVGYWIVGHPAETYPAGVDEGPAETYGDYISVDGGASWEKLSEIDPPNLDYNWNLQFYIEDVKGKEVLIESKPVTRQNDGSDLVDGIPELKKSDK